MNGNMIKLVLQRTSTSLTTCYRCSAVAGGVVISQNYYGSTCQASSGLVISRRFFNSKTPISKGSLAVAPAKQDDAYEIQSDRGIELQSASQGSALSVRKRRNQRDILRIPESELENYPYLLKKRPPLLDRRGEAQSEYLKAFGPPVERNNADVLAAMHGDWDFRPVAIRRWFAAVDAHWDIKQQAYNPKRNAVLGSDLAAAHFVVFRKGKVRFQGETEWVTEYRKDAKTEEHAEDLPRMTFDLCTLPVKYHPRYRVEAIDVTGMPMRYEGLQNFQNLNHVKWLSFKDAPLIDDWCLDRIVRIFHENLEYIDLSGCTRVTDRGIGALIRCKFLKTLVVENMAHVKNLEIVSALLEDGIPGLMVFGIDYDSKMEQLRIEGEELEQKALEEQKKLEDNTITVEPQDGPGPNPTKASM